MAMRPVTEPCGGESTTDSTGKAPARIPVRQSLTFRQAAVTVLIVTLLGLLGAVIEIVSDWKAMRGEIGDQTPRTLGLVRSSATEAAYQFHFELAEQTVEGLFAHGEIERVVLRDNFDKIMAVRERLDAGSEGRLAAALFGDIVDYRIPLQHESALGILTEVGSLEVRLAADEIARSFLQRSYIIATVGIAKALIISALVVSIFYLMITRPLLRLHGAILAVDPARPGQWQRPTLGGHERDELGQIVKALDRLLQASQRGLDQRDRAHGENARLGAELDVSRRMQQILLPSQDELDSVEGLDIAAYMEPASEVGGDYYDILRHAGGVRIGIGDVTGHGLESGVVMLMTQSAVRTLLTSSETSVVREMEILNTTIYGNVQRMGCGKNLTLALLDYEPVGGVAAAHPAERGRLRICGQHESVIIVRDDGSTELIDTDKLGFPIGLVEQVAEFVDQADVSLRSGDVVVVYTDGFTEAADEQHVLYGLNRLIGVVEAHHARSAVAIKDAIVADVKRHIGAQVLYDDLTLVVLKQC